MPIPSERVYAESPEMTDKTVRGSDGTQRTIEDYYSYAEIALLCRRAVGTIKVLVCKHRIPHVRAKGTHRSERIALVPAEGVKQLRRLTLGVE